MSIKVIESPSVYLVGRQQTNVPDLDRFLDDEGVPGFQSDATKAGEELVEIAGRLCYMSFKKPRPGGNAKYIEHILEVGHGSVTEHCVFNFIVTGVSRSLTHELVRHRVGFSYSQLSQRYVDESDVAFVVPPALIEPVMAAKEFVARFGEPYPSAKDALDYAIRHRDSNDGYAQPSRAAGVGLVWLRAAENALADYRTFSVILPEVSGFPGESEEKTLVRKRAREAARSVLPNCTETKIFVTANVRALRHFVELRGSEGADAEIRRLAFAFLDVLRKEASHLFGDYGIDHINGVEAIRTPYPKV